MGLSPVDEPVVITDEELKSLTDAIQKRHGIDFACYEPQSLKRRVVRALHVFQLHSIHELWVKILKEQNFIFPFMDTISVGLTAMFRDPVLWKKMKSIINESSATTELAIWHAGCSTGEEVYTMGIVLKESNCNRKLKVHATDISKQAMEVAQRGEFSKGKLEEYQKNYTAYNPFGSLTRYGVENDGTIKMDTSLIKHVAFDYHNLITSPFLHKYDIIFCRNVMIYFDNATKLKLFEKFHKALNPNGLLIIGFYDAVLPLIDAKKFTLLDVDAKIFQRTDDL